MALMSLIVACYDDYLNEDDVSVYYRWDRIRAMLSKDKMNAMKMPDLFYYTFRQTSGFNCFIITKTALRIEFL
ncbi:hypothetical protein D3C80_1181510 [compost metagenome]